MSEQTTDQKTNNEQSAPGTAPQVNVTVQQAPERRRIGKTRSVFAPLLLPIVTLGIYSLVWLYKLYTEADYYCEGKVNITSGGAAVGFLFIPIFNFFWAISLWFKTPGLITLMQRADGVPENEIKHYGNYGWLMLIPILGQIMWIVLTQSAMNQYWERVRA